MSENLKVNANSSVLEHKRKHNLLVDAVPQKDTDGNYKIFENIVDRQGNPRFIEGDITINTITGITQTYGKWSLSGSHLMVVVGCNFENEAVIAGQRLAVLNVPNWVKDKIKVLFSTIVIRHVETLWAVDYTTQTMIVNIEKDSQNTLFLYIGPLTLNKDRIGRFEFDLLIDNAEPETQGE